MITTGSSVVFYYIALDEYNSRRTAGTLEDNVLYYVFDNTTPTNNFVSVGSVKFTQNVSAVVQGTNLIITTV